MAIIEDWRTQVAGGFRGALDLWELAIMPSLLYNSETWIEMSKESLGKLEEIQLFFLRLALRVPKGTPKAALRSETGMLSMKVRVWKKKFMFIHHVRKLEDKDLAKKIWKQQVFNDWPGLAREVSGICNELGIDDANVVNCTRI